VTLKPRHIHVIRLAAALPLLIGSIIAAADEQAVPWKTGAVALPATSIEQMETAIAEASGERMHVVARFDAVPSESEREALAASGLHVLSYIGSGAYFASIDVQTTDAATLAATPGLVGLAAVNREWKLHPALAARQIPDWAVVDVEPDGQRCVAAYVVFHQDVDLIEGAELVEAGGGAVVGLLESMNALVVETSEESIETLAAADEVQWIEPPLPQLSPTNDGVRLVTQADEAQAPPYELDGSGVTVLVYDGGTGRETHLDFQSRLLALDSSGLNAHATHVAGTIGGAGVANPLYRGVAPGVTMLSYGLEGAGSDGPLYTNPGDLENDFADAILAGGAVLSNTSLGSNVEANGFDCEWQGDYGVTGALIDGIVRGSFGEPFRAVWAAGNERPGYRCNIEGYGEYYSIAPPSGAKNQLCVGAVNSNDDESMTGFSSWGPTDDGRLKPDICAPGCQVEGDYGITSCSSSGDSSYHSMCGTSMASPAVCGLSALVLQDYQEQFPGQPLPRNSFLKALFAHTAADLGNVGPDYCFGYGSARVRDAIDMMRTGRFCEDVVDHGESYTRTVTVEAGDPELKVTLAWDDVPGTPNAEIVLVNDLDLVAVAPDGTRHYPWTLDPLAPSDPAVRTQADHRNNIEQVLVENPAAGEWTISVEGHNVPDGPQPFSLIGDGAQNIVTVIYLPDGLPDLVAPGAEYDFDVRIAAFGQELVAGSAVLHYRVDDGEFTEVPLTELGGGLYRVALPACECGEVPSYYVSVESTVLGTTTLPRSAPAETFTHGIGAWTPLFVDNFEYDGDWTVIDDAISGNWERADPEEVISLGVVTQPEDDHTPGWGSLCYVTGPLAGLHASMYDVDGGPSHLISPVIDLAGRDAIIGYWRWYHMSTNTDDTFVVAVTNDGVNWTTVEEILRSFGEWMHAEWRVADYVEPTATVQVRFTVNDTDPGSLIEGLVDDFSVVHLTCGTQPVTGDLDGDGDVDLSDLAEMLANYGTTGGATYADGDLDGDEDVDLSDLALLLSNYGAGG